MKFKLFMPIIFLTLLVACASERNPTVNQTAYVQPTYDVLTSSPTSAIFSDIPIIEPTYTAETVGLKTQCLDLTTKRPSELKSSGIVILDRVNSGDSYNGNTLLLNMETGNTVHIDREHEGQINHIVSPNKDLMAYESFIFNSEGNIMKDELVIANATDNHLKIVPWEKEWLQALTWLDNEHLIISLLLTSEENFGKKPLSMLVLNPFSGERQILKPDFPGLLNAPLPIIPSWNGWYGVVYDPTQSFAIYPYRIRNNDLRFTYAIWDLSKQKLVASLENIFAANSYDPYPMPRWSPDGSQFVFRSVITTSDTVKFDLYRVKSNGQVEQLTHLSSIAHVQDSNLSWSPDGRYIAMFLNKWDGYDEKEARVALLDTEALKVTDYCISVTYEGEGYGGRNPSAAVWSPDSKQFLVVDWYERDHQRLILVDIEKNMAIEISENMEPMGWMIAP